MSPAWGGRPCWDLPLGWALKWAIHVVYGVKLTEKGAAGLFSYIFMLLGEQVLHALSLGRTWCSGQVYHFWGFEKWTLHDLAQDIVDA